MTSTIQKAIIIGASSGIGAALAEHLSQQGVKVGICARRVARLEELSAQNKNITHTAHIDVMDLENAIAKLKALIAEMGSVDLIVVNSGVGQRNPTWADDQRIISVNVTGFTAMVNTAYDYFAQRGEGHLVGISSIAAVRGNRWTPSYGASKAYVSNYLEGKALHAAHEGLSIYIHDIRPGYVATEMTDGNKNMFWVATAEKASAQIFSAIRRRKRVAYITRRWKIVAWVLKLLPFPLYWRIV